MSPYSLCFYTRRHSLTVAMTERHILMSKSITLEVKVLGVVHTLKISSRRQAEKEITALFPADDWNDEVRQAHRKAIALLKNAWTAEFGKGSSEPQTKARKARPSGHQLARWQYQLERDGVSDREKPFTDEEQRKIKELAVKIEAAAALGKERKASRPERRMTHKRANRLLSSLEAMKGCKAPKQGPAIEMALTPARKLASKKLRKARADRKADINSAKLALAKRFKSLADTVINAAVEAAADYFEAIYGMVSLKAIKKAASSRLVYKATREERNAFFAEQRA